MAPKVIDYSKSVIYKIEHIDSPELLYVGSTTDFIRRKSNHKSTCENINGRDYNFKLYEMIRSNGGFNNFKCIVIKEFPCNNKTELVIEEEKHRKELQSNLNSIRCFNTIEDTKEQKKEYYENNKESIKEHIKEYKKVNKEQINEKAKEYYKVNKEQIFEYKKEYYQTNKELIKKYQENNKEKINEKAKEYRENNKEKIKKYYELNKEKLKEKMTCNCGSIIRKSDKSKHEKTLKHINFINN